MISIKKFNRYGSPDLGIPPLSIPKRKSIYPQFPPDAGSFKHDKYIRSADTYSTLDYQIFLNSKNVNSDVYREAMLQGVDLFQNYSKKIDKWYDEIDPEDDDVVKKVKKLFRKTKIDPDASYKKKAEIIDIIQYFYTPYNYFIYNVNRLIRSIYIILKTEPVSSAILKYYYFYYYFFFTEYNLEHLSLYFNFTKSISTYQLFSDFNQFYFNFQDIFLGCYLPFIIFFIFSQYHLFRGFFISRVYFFAGLAGFAYTFSLIPIYYFTGYSALFYFYFSFLFFVIFSIFYIFEYSSFQNYSRGHFIFSNYFLPFKESSNHKIHYFFPLYYYKFNNWPKLNYNSLFENTNKKNLRIPCFFMNNLKSISLKQKRLKRFNYLALKYKNYSNKDVRIPILPISGLIFPKANFNGYSLKSHKNFIKDYPFKDYNPYTESDDLDFYHFVDQETVSESIQNFINSSDGYSNISFLDFMYNNKSFRSLNSDFNYIPSEYKDLHKFFPSNTLFKHLYPYVILNMWIYTIKPERKSFFSNLFIVNIPYTNKISNVPINSKTSVPAIVPKYVWYFDYFFFLNLEIFFNKITFYYGYKFPDCENTNDLINSIKIINNLLSKDKHYSNNFYRKLGTFVFKNFRMLINLVNTNRLGFTISQLLTLMLVIKQLEELYILLLNKNKSYVGFNKYLNFSIKIVSRSIEMSSKSFSKKI